jgi:hypothetical protein
MHEEISFSNFDHGITVATRLHIVNGEFVTEGAQRRSHRRCAALLRSVQRPKGARLSAGLAQAVEEVAVFSV